MITGIDSMGPWTDTGINTAATPRANVQVESHLPSEIDTGSKNSPVLTQVIHVPQRPGPSPR